MRASAIESTRTEGVVLAFMASTGLLLSGGVIVGFIYLFLAVASFMTLRPAFAQSAPVVAGVRLEAGIEKEQVEGDLKSAMDIYQKIAADGAASRDVRAQALLRLAGCDEKLGHQARLIYEQIVHDYGDMPAAVQARNRLAALKQQEHPALPTTMSVRKIEASGLGELYSWATDGERAVYRASDRNLYVGDVAGHNKRLIFRAQQRKLDGWRPSPDFSMIELLFESTPREPGSLAVIKSDGTGYRELIHDDDQNILTHNGVTTLDWSWDNRYLLLLVRRPNGSRLFFLSAADGQQRELKLPDPTCLSRAAFSPNGRFIAYEVLPACDLTKTGTRRIFVMPIEGGETPLVYESRLQARGSYSLFKNWTADGHYLIIHDLFGRAGKLALFLLPMKDGVAAGAPQLIRYGDDFGESWTAASGAFVYADTPTRPPGANVFQASLDEGDHPGRWQRLELRGGRFPGGDHSVSFSPDGTELFYQAPSAEAGKTDLVVRRFQRGENEFWISYRESISTVCMRQAPQPFYVPAPIKI